MSKDKFKLETYLKLKEREKTDAEFRVADNLIEM